MKLFPQIFAFLFFISIQFKVQHVNSTAKVGISPETAKLSAIFFTFGNFQIFRYKYVETILSIYYPCARS
jgi:hypothetical protein